MLTGMLTHGLTPCIIYHDQNDYASLRNPGFCLRQTAIRYDTTLTKQMKGGFGPSSHDFPRNLHSPRFSSIDKGYFEPATKTHGTHGDFTIPQQRWSTEEWVFSTIIGGYCTAMGLVKCCKLDHLDQTSKHCSNCYHGPPKHRLPATLPAWGFEVRRDTVAAQTLAAKGR